MKKNKGVLVYKSKIKNIKVLGIMGFVTTQLLLTWCGCIEKQPIIDPIISTDEYFKGI